MKTSTKLFLIFFTLISYTSYCQTNAYVPINIQRKALNVDGYNRTTNQNHSRTNSSGFITPVPLNESTPLEKINLQIQRIFYSELDKYSDFYLDNHPPRASIPVITDSETDENENSVLIGEYTYTNDYMIDNVFYTTPKRSFKFKATVKKILDENKVSKIIYQKGDEWYKIFPAN